MKKKYQIFLFIFAGFIVYLPSLSCGFIWDDDLLLTNNPIIISNHTPFVFWFTTKARDFFPTTYTYLWILWKLFPHIPFVYHLSNVILFIISAVILWMLLETLKISGAKWCALIYLVHPVNVETVSWITQHKNTLSLLFYLISLNSFFSSRDNRKLYWLSILFYFLSITSKTSVAGFPFVLALLIYWQKRLFTFKDFKTVLPFFFISVIVGTLELWFHNIHKDQYLAIFPYGIGERIAVGGRVFFFYLYKAVMPLNLSFVYPRWDINLMNPGVYLPALAVMLMTVSIFCLKHRFPSLFALFFFYLLNIFPVMGFIDIYYMRYSRVADHWQYLSLIAVVTGLVSTINNFISKSTQGIKRVCFLVFLIISCLLSFITLNQQQIYKDQKILWKETIKKTPTAWIAYNNLAIIYLKEGELEASQKYTKKSLELEPMNEMAVNNMGSILSRQNKPKLALDYFKEAIRIQPDFSLAHFNLGLGLMDLGEYRESYSEISESLRIYPLSHLTRNARGNVLQRMNFIKESIPEYKEAIKLNPDFHLAYYNLANGLVSLKNYNEAIKNYEMALSISPDFYNAHFNLGMLFSVTGDKKKSIGHFLEVIRLNPGFYKTYYLIGNEYSAIGDFNNAIKSYTKALSYNSSWSEPRINLAWILATCPLDNLRNPKKSWQLLSSYLSSPTSNVTILETIAVSAAAVQKWDIAVKTIQKAIALTEKNNRSPSKITDLKYRLELFLNKKPFIDHYK